MTTVEENVTGPRVYVGTSVAGNLPHTPGMASSAKVMYVYPDPVDSHVPVEQMPAWAAPALLDKNASSVSHQGRMVWCDRCHVAWPYAEKRELCWFCEQKPLHSWLSDPRRPSTVDS